MKRPCVPAPGEFAAESLEVLLLSLPPRRRLPSERLLCEKWGVSRGTLRTALRRLTAAGRLVALGGSGYTVAPPRPEWNAAGKESLFETLRRKAQRPHGELLDVWEHSSKLPFRKRRAASGLMFGRCGARNGRRSHWRAASCGTRQAKNAMDAAPRCSPQWSLPTAKRGRFVSASCVHGRKRLRCSLFRRGKR